MPAAFFYGEDMKESLKNASFDKLKCLKYKLEDQRHLMENMLLEWLQTFAFLGSHTRAERQAFGDEFQHLLLQVQKAEDMISSELGSMRWITCPECHGSGGKWYQDWETCMRCWGGGKVRPEKTDDA